MRRRLILSHSPRRTLRWEALILSLILILLPTDLQAQEDGAVATPPVTRNANAGWQWQLKRNSELGKACKIASRRSPWSHPPCPKVRQPKMGKMPEYGKSARICHFWSWLKHLAIWFLCLVLCPQCKISPWSFLLLVLVITNMAESEMKMPNAAALEKWRMRHEQCSKIAGWISRLNDLLGSSLFFCFSWLLLKIIRTHPQAIVS